MCKLVQAALAASVGVFDQKFIDRQMEADAIVLNEFEQTAKNTKVSEIKDELISAYPDIFNTSEMKKLIIQGTRAASKNGDPKDYVYLKDIYADYLRQKNVNTSAPLSWPYKQRQNPDPSFSYFAKE